MAMQQCPNGHLYDDAKNSSCPYCSNGNSMNVTVPLSDGMFRQGSGDMFPPTAQLDSPMSEREYVAPRPQVAQAPQNSFPATAPVEAQFAATTYKEDIVNEKGIVEVRGWLVCLEGEKRGIDFKIHGEKNTIGRGSENDVKIDFDSSISKGINAIISYDLRNNKFFIFLGESKNNIYVNDQLLMTPIELKDYDIIEIGQTKLLFRSLCNDRFTWEASKKAAEKAE
ncbi:MAG: FHA domain-containing protein [Oscillospiraceae bacterium]|nr:FHA domain-containing protein [Oscillospiraceae bacterium]